MTARPRSWKEGPTQALIGVEVYAYLSDDDYPVRMVVLDENHNLLTEVLFTPRLAVASADYVAEQLSSFLCGHSARKVADNLVVAARKVWAARN